MALFAGKEKKLQLYFGDDNTFSFIKRVLGFTCLLEKTGEKLTRAWKHFYSNQIPFPGYKKMPAGHVMLAFSRDIILDPFDKIPKGESINQKPLSGKENIKKWIAQIAENQRHIFRAKRETHLWTSRLTWGFLGVLFVMVLIWAIAFLKLKVYA